MKIRDHSKNEASPKSNIDKRKLEAYPKVRRLIKYGILSLPVVFSLLSHDRLPPVDANGLTENRHKTIPNEYLEELGLDNKSPQFEGLYRALPLDWVSENSSMDAEEDNTTRTVQMDYTMWTSKWGYGSEWPWSIYGQ